jgi:hypothetical protein
MESAKASRISGGRRILDSHPGGAAIDPQPLVGAWMNTNTGSRGITKVSVSTKDGGVVVRAFGACEPSPCDWGESYADVFADDPDSIEGNAFNAFYDFGFMEIRLQAHIRQGLLVVAKFDRFKDNSGRANYFSKEFFFHAAE